MSGGGGGRGEGGGGGGGDEYGWGSGNFNNPSPSGNFAPSANADGGLRGGYGPGGQGPSPGMKNNFSSPGASSSGGPPQQGPPPPLPAGTPPPGEQSAQNQGMMPRGRGTGSIFYKTKLCSRFRNSSCPYSTNCNFAHGPEELRRPPPGWEDVAGPQEGWGPYGGGGGGGGSGGGGRGGSEDGNGSAGMGGADAHGAPNHQAPSPNQVANPSGGGGGGGNSNGNGNGNGTDGGNGTGGGSSDRFHKTRPCKKFMSGQVCPYGDRCNFLHDEPTAHSPPPPKSAREVVVAPVPEGGGGGGGGGPNGSGAGTPTQRPPNWKTRLCNKWETTANCPFGDKCHFAHGSAELHRYGGGPVDQAGLEAAQMESKYGMNPLGSNFGDEDEGSPFYNDGYPQGGTMRQSSGLGGQQIPRLSSGLGSKFSAIWKGPTDGISTIYGDWLEDDG